jgi:hypothetical protein
MKKYLQKSLRSSSGRVVSRQLEHVVIHAEDLLIRGLLLEFEELSERVIHSLVVGE